MAGNKHEWPIKLGNVKKWKLDAFECIYVQFSSCVSTSVHAFKNSFYSDSDSFELNFRIWGFNMLLYFIVSSGLCHVVCKRVGLATQCPADCSWLSRRWISSAALCPCLWWSPRVGLLAPRLAWLSTYRVCGSQIPPRTPGEEERDGRTEENDSQR